MRSKVKAHEAFKEDPITKGVDELNKVLNEYGYKCDGISVKPKVVEPKPLYVIDGFVVTKETYERIKGGQ